MNFGNSEKNTTWEEPPAKLHPARLIGHYDIGTQDNYDKTDTEHQVILVYALVGNAKKKDGTAFTIAEYRKVSLSTKSALMDRYFALGVQRFEVVNPDKFGGFYKVPKSFDPKTLLGRSCMVKVAPKKNGEGVKVESVLEPMEGVEIPLWEGDIGFFDMESPDFNADFEKCPEFVRKKIMLSKEWNKPMAQAPKAPEHSAKFEDDIPL